MYFPTLSCYAAYSTLSIQIINFSHQYVGGCVAHVYIMVGSWWTKKMPE